MSRHKFISDFDMFLLACFFILIVVFSNLTFANSFSDNLNSEIFNLTTGKNYLNFSKNYYASEIVSMDSRIQYISYVDKITNETIGYVNIYGGVGKNFVTETEVNYEVYIKDE